MLTIYEAFRYVTPEDSKNNKTYFLLLQVFKNKGFHNKWTKIDIETKYDTDKGYKKWYFYSAVFWDISGEQLSSPGMVIFQTKDWFSLASLSSSIKNHVTSQPRAFPVIIAQHRRCSANLN